MRVRMLSTAAGPQGSFISGQSYDLPDALARQFISARAAVEFLGPVFKVEPKEEDEDEITEAPTEAERADARPSFKKRWAHNKGR